MPIIPINSLDDDRLAIFRALPKSQLAKQGGFFITEGDTVTERMFASSYEPLSVLVEPQYVEKYARLTGEALPIYVVEHDLMQAVVGFPFHRGVMGCGLRKRLPQFAEVIPAHPQECLLVVLPETQDPTNLGTMLRTCTAFGCDAVLLGPNCADLFSRRVIRVSMGAALRLPLALMRHPVADFAAIQRDYQVELCATVLDATAESLLQFSRSRRTGLVFGSEGHGLPQELIHACQRRITLPMHPHVDSLNAAIAAGIFIYEFAKTNRWLSA